jgi:hypothetical protein
MESSVARSVVGQHGEVSETIYVEASVLQRVVNGISHDLVVTSVKDSQEAATLAHGTAQAKAQIGYWAGRDEDEFAMFVAEDVQQELHDTFEDTTWPACPEHGSHPLWLHRMGEDGPANWCCPSTARSYGRLGELAVG